MADAQHSRKNSTKTAPEIEKLIIQVSLQHPDLGPRRIIPLLNLNGNSVSASTVYSILKRHGLQTRDLRLLKRKEQQKKQKPARKKVPAKIPENVEMRVVDVSLENPGFGARRIVRLLKQEDITLAESTVYKILKRNGLQTRAQRLLKIEEKQPVESPAPSGEPEQIPEKPAVVSEPQQSPEKRNGKQIYNGSRNWIFHVVNIVLLAIFVFLGKNAAVNLRQALATPEPATIVKPAPVRAATFKATPNRSLAHYRSISERDLFGTQKSKAKAAEKPKEIAPEKIPVAGKNLGLKLVGTIVAGNPEMSRAIIDNRKIRKQEAYREGDRVGEVTIKKVLRNKVIIATKKGDKLLSVDTDEPSKGSKTSGSRRQIAARSTSSQQTPASNQPGSRAKSISLNLEEVEASLADTTGLLKEVKISPFMQDDQPGGFQIKNIASGSVLAKMGLRNGHIITGVNDEEITTADQAAEFFKTLADGGEISIMVRKGKGVRKRSQLIRLNIE
jgi:general secretion pathway protein C